MSRTLTSTRRYAARGIGELPASRSASSVSLPSADEATLLPNPMRVHEDLRERFVALRGAIDEKNVTRPAPRLTVRDAKQIANHLTLALRNDLPRIDPHDAAVIWEKWRKYVALLREAVRELADDDQAIAAAASLDWWTLAIHDDLAEALRDPGKVFQRYCPWRADWATFERIHPEAV